MPVANVREIDIHYDIVGRDGPWVTYCGGGRSDMEAVRPLAHLVASAGYRVVIFDRRNCGASDFSIYDFLDEQTSWAEDAHALLARLGALPVLAGGASAGCRLALMMAVRHPASVAGLFVARPSGGQFAATYLAASNYDPWLEAAEAGGMAAVCELPTMIELIARNPSNQSRLLQVNPTVFVKTVNRWRAVFTDNADLTLMGVTDQQLSSIEVPVCIVAGQDDLHPRARSERFHQLVPNSEIHYLHTEEEVERIKSDGYQGAYATVQETPEELAHIFVDFLNRVSMRAANASEERLRS